MTLARLDVVALRRWVVTARADLATHAASLDRLNVFPVPDGDTGTNLLLTMDQALHTLAEEAPTDLVAAAEALSRATLVAARGNSGVILSQLTRGVAQVVRDLGGDSLDGQGLAAALRRASDLARAGVGDPVEGTMLTVAEQAAIGADRAAHGGGSLEDVVDAGVGSASSALIATRDQLDVLHRAGVVDAGGAGYLLVIEALQRIVHGTPGTSTDPQPAWLTVSEPHGCGAEQQTAGQATGPAYEVMYLLDGTDDERLATLRSGLAALGDSLIIAGGPDLYSVHVHVDDVGPALDAGADAGRPHHFSVTRFADQAGDSQGPATGVCRIVLADGAGFADVARAAGAQVPESASAGMPSVAEYVALAERSGAPSVLLLAASRDAAQTAMEVARLLEREGRTVAVPRCHHPAHVLAALAVIDPAADLASMMHAIRDAVQDVRIGSVEQIGPGERSAAWIGQEQVAVTDEVLPAAETLIDTMLEQGGELVTLITGRGVPDDVLGSLEAHVRAHDSGLEVTTITGGGVGAAVCVGVE